MSDIDEIAIERARMGDRMRLNLAERRELWRRVAHEMTRDPDLTVRAVADRLHVSERTATRRMAALRAQGVPIPLRSPSHPPLRDARLLRQLYVEEGMSINAISVRLRCSRFAASRAIDAAGIQKRDITDAMRLAWG